MAEAGVAWLHDACFGACHGAGFAINGSVPLTGVCPHPIKNIEPQRRPTTTATGYYVLAAAGKPV